MDNSFTQWRDSSRSHGFDSKSFVLSESDDDEVVQSSIKKHVIIDDSDEDNDSDSGRIDIVKTDDTKSRHHKNALVDPRKSIEYYFKKKGTFKSKSSSKGKTYSTTKDLEDSDYDEPISNSSFKSTSRKRKDVSHDITKEDIKEFKNNSSDDSINETESFEDAQKQSSDNSSKTSESQKDEASDGAVILVDSDSHSGHSESELAISLAKQEVGVRNIDPLLAQKRAMIVCKLQNCRDSLAAAKRILTDGKVEMLEDKGEKLRETVLKYKREIERLQLELENLPLTPKSIDTEKKIVTKAPSAENKLFTLTDSVMENRTNHLYMDIDNIPMRPTTSPEARELGKRAQETRDKELALTIDRLQDLHGSLVARPSEDEKAVDPRGLKVPLMPHQQHALAWLLWRERQKPSGGVLADDMGLGKTLTMISLIMTTLAKKGSINSDDSDNSDSEYSGKSLRHTGGTLVVCPASLLMQWEKEVQDKCKRGILSVEVYHGSNRENVPSRLARNDIIITTYNIVAREYKTNSTLFKIQWKRVILDEAHIIRNHKSQAAQAVCGLIASKRWALTGTPIQNKEMDLYSILKFLKCSPFDDLRVWKRWVDNKNAAGQQRLATVMKTLMLRRVKQELQAQGRLENLPDKSVEEVIVKLDTQEQLVYEKILIYSRTLFAQFLSQRAEKDHMVELFAGKYDLPTYRSNPNKETQFTKAQNKLLAMHADVKTHEILVLLLRLRQVCCHPALIHAMLDQEEMKESEIMDMENVNPKLLSRLNRMSLKANERHENSEEEKEEDVGINRQITENLLTSENPVFDNARVSSKMRVLLDTVKEILQKGDKLIIVSQWASMLDVIGTHLGSLKGATFTKFTGSVAIKDRQNIMDSFNSPNSGPKILLLSLTAGGVGLNLVGGNHLLLFDIHWNPQLETQAQDRIYRFGQKKNVYIYKFICCNTIEERIKMLQDRKLSIAQNVLSGDRSKSITKLTFNDLKSLFAM